MNNLRALLSVAVLAAAVGMAVTLAATTPALAQDCPGNPDALGTSRVLVIDPADYPRLGIMQYPQTLPLNDHEVVLTFDDGPLPPYSTAVLNALAAQCVKATFFLVGEMARAFPGTVRRVHADGHTIGTHSEDHPLRFRLLPPDRLRREIERGIADVGAAAGDPEAVAPFFRIPGLDRSDAVEDELDRHSLAVFSADFVADDWHRHISPKQIIARAMSRLEAKGKGILLLHDIHPWTAAALPGLFKELKDHNFHIVQVVPTAAAVARMIAGPSELTVAWSPAGQDVMDDGGNRPAWPKLGDGTMPEPTALLVPDAASFAPDYVVASAPSTADVEFDTPSIEADGEATPWPQAASVALASADAQLPAPSVQDIGWPVQKQRIVEAEPAPEPSPQMAGSNEPSEPIRVHLRHGRLNAHRHAHAHVHAHAHTHAASSHQAEPASTLATMLTPAH